MTKSRRNSKMSLAKISPIKVKIQNRMYAPSMHEKVLAYYTVEDILRWPRLQSFDHLTHMKRICGHILNFEIPGRLPRGHPKKHWRENITEDMKKLRHKPFIKTFYLGPVSYTHLTLPTICSV